MGLALLENHFSKYRSRLTNNLRIAVTRIAITILVTVIVFSPRVISSQLPDGVIPVASVRGYSVCPLNAIRSMPCPLNALSSFSTVKKL
jgi:hypothetical protein